MNPRYRVLIAVAVVFAVGLLVHFGGQALVDAMVQLHS
jgi:hypothetical protein